MRFNMMAFVAAVSLAVPAVAQTAPAADAAAPKPAKEKKTCRRDGPATGSILGGHVTCHTKTEWAAIDRNNSDSVDRARDAQMGGLGTGPGSSPTGR